MDANSIQQHQKELCQKLWAMANALRGNMEAYEFKNYILGMIFYYYLSDRTEKYMVNLLKDDGISYEKAWADQEYQDYKSKYLMLYRKHQTGREVISVLDDVDFCIELMESDRINVAYIMNLIRNINFQSKQTRDKDIEHIKDELDRSDNMRLHKKIDILRAFLIRYLRM